MTLESKENIITEKSFWEIQHEKIIKEKHEAFEEIETLTESDDKYKIYRKKAIDIFINGYDNKVDKSEKDILQKFISYHRLSLQNDHEIQECLKSKILYYLNKGNVDWASYLVMLEVYNKNSSENLEIQQYLMQYLEKSFWIGVENWIIPLIEHTSLPRGLIKNNGKIQARIKSRFVHECYNHGKDVLSDLDLLEREGIVSHNLFSEIAIEAMGGALTSEEMGDVVRVAKIFLEKDPVLKENHLFRQVLQEVMAIGYSIISGFRESDAEEIKRTYSFSNEEIIVAKKYGAIKALLRGELLKGIKLIKDYQVSLEDNEVQEAVKKGLIQAFKQGENFDDIRKFLQTFDKVLDLSKDPDMLLVVKEYFVVCLEKERLYNLHDLNEYFKFNFTVDEIINITINAGKGSVLANYLERDFFSAYKEKIEALIGKEYHLKYRDKIKEVLCNNHDFILNKKDLSFIEKVENKLQQLSFSELQTLKAVGNNLDKYSLADNESAKNVYLELKEKAKDWQDSEINKRFEMGAEFFGYHRMFEFAKPSSRHDALYAFDKIIELYQKSGLPLQQFFNNILRQVASQDGMLGEATYYQALNDIASGFDGDFEKVFKEAREYDIETINELLEKIGEPKNIFNDFKSLSNYHELSKQLQRKDLLDKIKGEPNEKLRNYVSTLLFHPTIENKQAVINFYENPAEFLGLDSSHTSEEIHDKKKSSNYTEIPNLDLDAFDMRDALVEGALDKIQVWQPLEIYYELPQSLDKYRQFVGQDVKKTISEALGKRGEIKGKVNNPEKMAKGIVDILQIKLSDLGKIINGEIVISDEQKNKIINLLYFDRFGYTNKTEKYLAKINLKSDPDGVVAGNDTKCCMPFGDGKNTLYAYNPICALFTLQKETGNGKYATIGQSVLTKDKNIGVEITKLKEALEHNQMKLQELVPEDVLRQTKSTVAADSVEVNENYKNEKYAQVIADLYKDFFVEYLAIFAKEQNLDEEKVITGSCSYQLVGLGSEANYFIPESPVAYSDKYKESVGVLDLTKKQAEYYKKQIKSEKINNKPEKKETLIDEPNVQYLTFQDTLPTAYLEGKIYQHTTMREGLHNMENGLIAKDINNARKDRPNMSLKYVSSNGKMQGYLIAYEGKINQSQLEDTFWFDQNCIYVADLAKSFESIKAGVALVNGFVELYDKNYLDKDKPLPIVARMRDTTSFRLVNKKLDKLTAGTGKKFVMEEISTEQDGEDLIHWVVIKPE